MKTSSILIILACIISTLALIGAIVANTHVMSTRAYHTTGTQQQWGGGTYAPTGGGNSTYIVTGIDARGDTITIYREKR